MNPNFSLVITGEWPGAGQSTTAKLLAKELGFDRVYAGALFRQFAHIWNQEKGHLTWADFEHRAQTNTLDLDAYPFNEAQFNEQVLHAWQHQLKAQNTPEVWDRIIDTQSLQALARPGVVVEAKVGVMLDHTGLLPNFQPAHPIYKFLLTCPPEISTHRIIKRKIENHELPPMDKNSETYQELVRETTTETIERHLRDWERYEKIYGIKRSDIYHKADIIKINTAQRQEAEVVKTILHILTQKQVS